MVGDSTAPRIFSPWISALTALCSWFMEASDNILNLFRLLTCIEYQIVVPRVVNNEWHQVRGCQLELAQFEKHRSGIHVIIAQESLDVLETACSRIVFWLNSLHEADQAIRTHPSSHHSADSASLPCR